MRRLEHKRSVGGNTRRSTSWVLWPVFLSALQKNREQSRFLYLFHDKESVKFPAHYFLFFNTNFISMFYNLIKHLFQPIRVGIICELYYNDLSNEFQKCFWIHVFPVGFFYTHVIEYKSPVQILIFIGAI